MIKFFLNKVPRKYLQKVANLCIPAFSFIYNGKNIYCPICNGNFRKILPYGYSVVRQNALCPRCLSLERHRMIWHYINTTSDFFTDHCKVLHVAPEFPFLKRFDKLISEKNGEYITADLESPIAKIKMDVQDIPFENNYFDIVICNHVLEHVDDDKKALKEIFRVLKKGGKGILLCPVDLTREKTYEDKSITSPELRKEHFGQYDHQRVYGRDYATRLTEAGFCVEEVNYKNTLASEQYTKMAFSDEILYIVKVETKQQD